MKNICLLILSLHLLSCSNELERITPPEIRAAEAKANLKAKLQAPTNGWLLEYQPTPSSGVFRMIIDFKENDIAAIKTDLTSNNGQFIEQDISYRIDNALSLELIFETYGAFHYLFELNRASFGAEFEFIYEEEDGDDLIFSSKTDFVDPTLIRLIPATPSDISSLTTTEAENINTFDSFTPILFGGLPPIQQIAFLDKNTSLFWFIDITGRTITTDFASSGITEAEVIASNDKKAINFSTGYKYQNGKLVLLVPLVYQFLGETYTINNLSLNTLSTNDVEVCTGTVSAIPVYSGSITGLGNVNISKSFLNYEGQQFAPQANRPYSVNALYAINEEAISLTQKGVLADYFPNASAIAFNYGFDSTEEPANAMGLYLDGDNGTNLTYLREFQVISQLGNRLEIQFTNNFYYSDPPQGTDEAGLIAFTDLIFEGGAVYIYDLPIDGLKIFWFYNPCNKHELILVQ